MTHFKYLIVRNTRAGGHRVLAGASDKHSVIEFFATEVETADLAVYKLESDKPEPVKPVYRTKTEMRRNLYTGKRQEVLIIERDRFGQPIKEGDSHDS